MVTLCLTLAQTAGQQAPAAGTNTGLLTWAVVWLIAALVLFGLELLIPSGGLISIIGFVAMVIGLVLLYLVDITLGLAGTAVCLIAIPIGISIAIKIFPHTWVGQKMILSSDKVEPENEVFTDTPAIGATGKSITRLRPVGTCIIDGKRVECISASGIIDNGTEVEVVAAGGMEVKVRAKE